MIEVSTDVSLSMHSPRNSNPDVLNLCPEDSKNIYQNIPQFVQFSVYLNVLDKSTLQEKSERMKLWFDTFNTSSHWSYETLQEKRCPFLISAMQ